MPISVGEVNAAIRFTVISDQLTAAKARLRELAEEFQATSQAMTPSQLAAQVKGLEDAQRAVMALQGSVGALGSGLTQLDMIATRLIERFLIMFAVREAIKFTVDVFETARALENLSNETGIAASQLDEFQRASKDAGVETKTLNNSIETLQKNLATGRGGTNDALVELGTTFDEINKKSPVEQFKQVMEALEGITDRSERQRLSLILLGTDAIDPLTRKFHELTEAQKNAGMDDTAIAALAAADKGYRDAAEGVKLFFGTILDKGQQAVSDALSPFFAFATGGFAALGEQMREIAVRANMLQPIKDMFVGPINQPEGIDKGEAFVQGLEARSGPNGDLNDIIRDRLQRLKDIGDLTEATARGAGATALAYHQFTEELHGNNQSLTEHDALLMREFRTVETITSGIVRDNEARRSSEETINQIMRTRSTLTDEQIKQAAEFSQIENIQANIADLTRQLEIIKSTYATKRAAMETDREVKMLDQEFARTSEQINLTLMKDYEKLNELLLKRAQILRDIRKANAEAFGQEGTGSGLPSDANLNVQDAAERRFERTMDLATKALEKHQITESDYIEIQKAAERAFMEEVASANQVTQGNRDLANSQKPVIDANNKAAAAAAAFIQGMQSGGGFHLPGFSLDRPFVDPASLLNPGAAQGFTQFAGAPVKVEINVSGVLDPATIKTLASSVGKEFMQSSNRQFQSR